MKKFVTKILEIFFHHKNVTEIFKIFHRYNLRKKISKKIFNTYVNFFHKDGKFQKSKIFGKCTRPFYISKIFSNTYVKDTREKFFMWKFFIYISEKFHHMDFTFFFKNFSYFSYFSLKITKFVKFLWKKGILTEKNFSQISVKILWECHRSGTFHIFMWDFTNFCEKYLNLTDITYFYVKK